MSQFDLNKKYAEYLEKVGLKEEQMHTIQKKETKQAFFGACGIMLLMLRDELSRLPEREGAEQLEDMLQQVSNYFVNETLRWYVSRN